MRGTAAPDPNLVKYSNDLIAAFGAQACFAVDYDFKTHQCFFFGTNVVVTFSNKLGDLIKRYVPTFTFLHCNAPTSAATRAGTSLNAVPNPTAIHITFCKYGPI